MHAARLGCERAMHSTDSPSRLEHLNRHRYPRNNASPVFAQGGCFIRTSTHPFHSIPTCRANQSTQFNPKFSLHAEDLSNLVGHCPPRLCVACCAVGWLWPFGPRGSKGSSSAIAHLAGFRDPQSRTKLQCCNAARNTFLCPSICPWFLSA